jgi:hypothetical protein
MTCSTSVIRAAVQLMRSGRIHPALLLLEQALKTAEQMEQAVRPIRLPQGRERKLERARGRPQEQPRGGLR